MQPREIRFNRPRRSAAAHGRKPMASEKKIVSIGRDVARPHTVTSVLFSTRKGFQSAAT